MAKIWLLFFLITVHQTVSLDIYLARMLLLSNQFPSNQYTKVTKTDDAVGIKINGAKTCQCDIDETVRLSTQEREGRFTFGEELNFQWLQELRIFKQQLLNGLMTITYENNKHKKIITRFTICKPYADLDPDDEESEFARQIFFKIFVKGYSEFWDCLEPKDVKVGDAYFFEHKQVDFIQCDALATIKFELYSTYAADCGVGGSGEKDKNTILRVFLNTKFYDCDGTKYAAFAGYPPEIVSAAKLGQAKNITDHLAKLPLNL